MADRDDTAGKVYYNYGCAGRSRPRAVAPGAEGPTRESDNDHRAARSIETDCKRLKGAGVEFVEDPTDYGNVSIATLRDPEGNLVQLLQFRKPG